MIPLYYVVRFRNDTRLGPEFFSANELALMLLRRRH